MRHWSRAGAPGRRASARLVPCRNRSESRPGAIFGASQALLQPLITACGRNARGRWYLVSEVFPGGFASNQQQIGKSSADVRHPIEFHIQSFCVTLSIQASLLRPSDSSGRPIILSNIGLVAIAFADRDHGRAGAVEQIITRFFRSRYCRWRLGAKRAAPSPAKAGIQRFHAGLDGAQASGDAVAWRCREIWARKCDMIPEAIPQPSEQVGDLRRYADTNGIRARQFPSGSSAAISSGRSGKSFPA